MTLLTIPVVVILLPLTLWYFVQRPTTASAKCHLQAAGLAVLASVQVSTNIANWDQRTTHQLPPSPSVSCQCRALRQILACPVADVFAPSYRPSSAVLGKLLFKSNLLQLLFYFKSNKLLYKLRYYMIYTINCRVCKFYFNYKYPMLSRKKLNTTISTRNA